MLWAVTAITFLATFAAVVAVFYAITPGSAGIAGRLSRFVHPTTAPSAESSFSDKQRNRMRDTVASIGKILPGDTGNAPRTQLLMLRAGYRSAQAILAMRGFKLLTPVAFVALVVFTGIYTWNPFMLIPIAGAVGYLFPEIVLSWRVNSRQHRLQRGLPDGLDLLVICV